MPFNHSLPTLDLHGQRRDKAIRKLTDFLERHRGGATGRVLPSTANGRGPSGAVWVGVVTGTGSHSHAGPVLKTAVQKALDRRAMEYRQDRPGRFLVNASSGMVFYNRQESAADTKVVVRAASLPEEGGAVGTSTMSDGFCRISNSRQEGVLPPTPPLPARMHRGSQSTLAQHQEHPPGPPWRQPERRRRRRQSSQNDNQDRRQNREDAAAAASDSGLRGARLPCPDLLDSVEPHPHPQGAEQREEEQLIQRVCSMSLLDLERAEKLRSEAAAAAEMEEMDRAVRLSMQESERRKRETAVAESEELERVVLLSLEDRDREEELERLRRESELEEIQVAVRMSALTVSAAKEEERKLLERVMALSRAEPQPEPFDDNEQIERAYLLSLEEIEKY